MLKRTPLGSVKIRLKASRSRVKISYKLYAPPQKNDRLFLERANRLKDRVDCVLKLLPKKFVVKLLSA